MGHRGEGSGAAAADAYVPRMMDLEYTPGEGPSSFPEPGWEGRTPEPGVFHELPRGFTDPFSDDDSRVQPVNCSDPTSDGQVSVLKCHPWIGMLTHTILEDL